MSLFKKYGATNEEDIELSIAQSREIVKEVLNFGVDQNQLLAIIKLLSLELENRETMLQIVGAIESALEIKNKLTIEV
tara:strand:+ start:736 stop:969 length:234 start_codon:yes stop_codon:yes gene_type:complete